MSGHTVSVDVAIIGGGVSGLAAAVELALEGVDVALFEQSSRLGGRCYSYVDEKTGDVVDNGQHILLGAYHNTLHYLTLIGTRDLLRGQSGLALPMHHPRKGFVTFKVSMLPRPLHLTAGMLKFKLLSLRERQKLIRAGLAIRRLNGRLVHQLSSLTVSEWLTSQDQSDEAKKCLWYPIAVSVMNEQPHLASALLFVRALHGGFFGNRSDSSILIPKVGQTELYARPAEKLLRQNGAQVFVNAEVKTVEVSKSRVLGVRLKNGNLIKADHVISAVPHTNLAKLIPLEHRKDLLFANAGKIGSSPIVSIHLWFDIEFMELEFVGLIDGGIQWVFNRRMLMGEKGKPTSYLSAVISGAHGYIDMAKDKLVCLALSDLTRAFPGCRRANLVHSVVIKEKRATFSPTNEVENLRPSAETPFQNFYLAGDWTNTGLPATIEGAVRSGFKAARMILKGA